MRNIIVDYKTKQGKWKNAVFQVIGCGSDDKILLVEVMRQFSEKIELCSVVEYAGRCDLEELEKIADGRKLPDGGKFRVIYINKTIIGKELIKQIWRK